MEKQVRILQVSGPAGDWVGSCCADLNVNFQIIALTLQLNEIKKRSDEESEQVTLLEETRKKLMKVRPTIFSILSFAVLLIGRQCALV